MSCCFIRFASIVPLEGKSQYHDKSSIPLQQWLLIIKYQFGSIARVLSHVAIRAMECHKYPSPYFNNWHLVILPALLLTQVMHACHYGQHVSTAMIYHVLSVILTIFPLSTYSRISFKLTWAASPEVRILWWLMSLYQHSIKWRPLPYFAVSASESVSAVSDFSTYPALSNEIM